MSRKDFRNLEYFCEECEKELESDRIEICCISATNDCECQGHPIVEELCESCENIKNALETLEKVKPCNDCVSFKKNECTDIPGCVFAFENFFERM